MGFLAVATTAVMWAASGTYARTLIDRGASTLEPLSAALFAYIWLDQRLGGWQLAGAALVLVAVAIVQTEREESAPAPSPLE